MSEDLGRVKKRLKEKTLKLINFRKSNGKMKNLQTIFFTVMNCLLIKYNHYVGILIVNILETVFLFFRSRANAKNIILYKTKLTNENQAKG